LGGGKFSASGSTVIGNNTSACSDPCTLSADYSTYQLRGQGPPLPSFPYTMLSVKRVKDIMWLAFVEKFFTNHEIGIDKILALQGYVI